MRNSPLSHDPKRPIPNQGTPSTDTTLRGSFQVMTIKPKRDGIYELISNVHTIVRDGQSEREEHLLDSLHILQ